MRISDWSSDVCSSDLQPIRSRTGGSTFKNPPGHKAWQLIDAAGCRGLTIGGAMVSDKHCNFLINTGTATAADLENLGEEVRRRVKASAGITLEWELNRLGVPEGGVACAGASRRRRAASRPSARCLRTPGATERRRARRVANTGTTPQKPDAPTRQ